MSIVLNFMSVLHLLMVLDSRFDKRIVEFAEDKFKRDGIDVKLGSMVTKVSDKEIFVKARVNGQVINMPYGMVIWSTEIGVHPVIRDFMKEVGQVKIIGAFSP